MNRRLHPFAGALPVALALILLAIGAAVATAGPSPAATISWTDTFDGPPLSGRWQWLQEDPTHWSLTANPGFLRITTRESFSGLTNLAYVPAPAGDYEIETRVEFTPVENYQIAGLYVVQDDANLLVFGRAYCDAPPPNCQGNAIYFDLVEDGVPIPPNFGRVTVAQDVAWLRIVRQGAVYNGYYSEDGIIWAKIGTHGTSIRPTKIGISASNQAQGASEIPADFDYFTLVDDSLRTLLPLAIGGD